MRLGQGNRSDLREGKALDRQLPGMLGHNDLTRLGDVEEAEGRACRTAHRRVVRAQRGADSADNDRSRVDSDANSKLSPVGPPHLVPHGLEALLYGKSGAERPVGMMLERSVAEEGHHSITQELVHRAAVLVHGLQHYVEGPVHDLADLLCIEMCGQRSEAGYIGEEHGDPFTLAAGAKGLAAGAAVVPASQALQGALGTAGARRRPGRANIPAEPRHVTDSRASHLSSSPPQYPKSNTGASAKCAKDKGGAS